MTPDPAPPEEATNDATSPPPAPPPNEPRGSGLVRQDPKERGQAHHQREHADQDPARCAEDQRHRADDDEHEEADHGLARVPVSSAQGEPRNRGRGGLLALGLFFFVLVLVVFRYCATFELHIPSGRPVRLRRRVVAPPRLRWGQRRPPEKHALSAFGSAWLALKWARDAEHEAASVTAFEGVARDLVALGAPPELVARARAAADEERGHLQATAELAASFRGRDAILAPPPLPKAPRSAHASAMARRADMVYAALVDGCYGEAVSAEIARAAARHAVDPTMRRALATIADEEASHAQLGWDLVEFACATPTAELAEPELAAAVAAARAAIVKSARRREMRGLQPARWNRTLAAYGEFVEASPGELAREVANATLARLSALVGMRVEPPKPDALSGRADAGASNVATGP